MPTVSGSLNVFAHNPKLCNFDSGTSICSKGYRLNSSGRCLSQSTGKANSTGFEPTYPICLVDYISSLSSYQAVLKAGLSSSSFNVQKDAVLGTVSGSSSPILKAIQTVSAEANQSQVQNGVDDNSVRLYAKPIHIVEESNIQVGEAGSSSIYKIHQAGKNVVHHDKDTVSDYWVVDTYTPVDITKNTGRISAYSRIPTYTKPTGLSYIICDDTYTLGITTPYKAVGGSFSLPLGQTLASGQEGDNPVNICKDDLVAPVVTGTNPVRGSHLNPLDSFIEFTIVDSVAGLDLGLLKVTVSGNTTVQPGGYLVVSSGNDQTSGRVSFYGDYYSYTVRYTPTLPWAYNEKITVTVSGQDRVPTVSGQPWSCISPDVRNVFGDSYVVSILDKNELGASITAVPDTQPPYLTNVSPIMYSRDNSSYSVVEFDIVDDVMGVELTSVNVHIGNNKVVENGVPQTGETSLVAIPGGYRVVHESINQYQYGSTISVIVEAEDHTLISNQAVISYHFTVVGEGTLIIENFDPLPNTSYLASKKNVCVDVYDTAFGIKNTHLEFNGTVYSGTQVPIYGNLILGSTISGAEVVTSSNIHGTSAYNFGAYNVTISGSNIYGGSVSSGTIFGGAIENFNAPYDLIPYSTLISGTIISGTLSSGTLTSTLVSGINWDGNYTDSHIWDVDVTSCYLLGTSSSGTTVSGIIGYNVCAHPLNDFDYEGTISTKVFAENRNSIASVIKRDTYNLYRGYKVTEYRYEMDHDDVVSVFARAVNNKVFSNELSSVYTFTTYSQPVEEISASITGIVKTSNLLADIGIISPTHSYGETITVEFVVQDNDGNTLGPVIWSYTIEPD